jgi:Ca2+-binding RTX toxin-like protein
MTSVFNVRDYGARGDASHNDTRAIQWAINAAAKAGGGEVYLPRGTYIVSATNDDGGCLTLKSHVSLVGAGQSQTALRLANHSTTDVDGIIRTSAHNDTLGASVRNLTLDGNASKTTGTVIGLVGGNANDLQAHTHDLTVSGVLISNCSGDGLRVSAQTRGLVVEDSVALGNGGDGFSTRLINSRSDDTGGPQFTDNIAAQNGGDGFDLHHAGSVSIFDNVSQGNAGNGIVLEKVAGAPASAAGWLWYGAVYGNGGAGIVERLLNPDIHSVAIHDNGGAGIRLEGTAHAAIVGNVLANNLQAPHPSGTADIQVTGYIDSSGTRHAADNSLSISGNAMTSASMTHVALSEEDNGVREFHSIRDNVFNGFGSASNGLGAVADNSSVPNRFYGSDADDRLASAAGAMAVFGEGGNDTLSGGVRNDRLDGGAGADVLTGGAGRDAFVFTQAGDSYRSGSAQTFDVITDLRPRVDQLDLTALGLHGLGNGLDGTVALSYDADAQQTYLRSLATSGPSKNFQVALSGDYRGLEESIILTDLHQGSAAADTLDDSARYDDLVLNGRGGADRLLGGSGNNRLYGGAGADTLTGNDGADHFIYQQTRDSFVNDRSGAAAVDVILDFDPYNHPVGLGGNDRIDVTALGFKALGNGYDGTLKLSAGTNNGYLLESLQADADGNRFSLRIEGPTLDSATYSDLANAFHFAPSSHAQGVPFQLIGSEVPDFLGGGPGADVLTGKGGGDELYGAGGNDVLEGGLGRDELVGGSGADIFRFSRVADSYRGANDVIDDFLPAKDVLDLSALGYTGFGDGTEGTVKVAFSSETGRSYVKSLDVDAAGQRFEITLIGDLAGALGTHNFIFDHPAANGWG